MTPPILVIDIPGLPRTANGGMNNWRSRHYERKKWKEQVAMRCLGQAPKTPLTKARLRLTRFSTTEPDRDNLAASFKGCIDGLVLGKIIVDDKVSVVGQPEFRWEKAPPKRGSIRIEVWEVTAPETPPSASSSPDE